MVDVNIVGNELKANKVGLDHDLLEILCNASAPGSDPEQMNEALR